MYRVTLTYNGNTSQKIFLSSDVKTMKEQAESQLFFRINLDGNLIAYEEAYDLINDAPFISKFDVLIERFNPNDQTYSDFLSGFFYKRDCTINQSNRSIQFSVTTIDKYTKFFESIDSEYNILDATGGLSGLPSAVSSNYNFDSYIQVALYDWIVSNDSIENKWTLITNSNVVNGAYKPYARHFSPVAPDADWTKVPGGYAREINSSDSNITDVYDGVYILIDDSVNVDKNVYQILGYGRQTFGYDGSFDPPGVYPPIDSDVWIPISGYQARYGQTATYDRGRLFWDVLEYVITRIDPTVTFDTTTDYSQFLFSATNPVTGEDNDFQYMQMLQKSDAVYNFGNASTAGQITLAQLTEVLNNAFHCYWFIDDQNRFRIEHRNWYDYGGVYYNKDNPGTLDQTYDLFTNATLELSSFITFTDESSIRRVFEFNTDNTVLSSLRWFKSSVTGLTLENKAFKISLSFHFEDWDTELDNYFNGFLIAGGYQRGFKIDAFDATTKTFEMYFLNYQEFNEFAFYISYFDYINRSASPILTGSKLVIESFELTTYDIVRTETLDLTKYIELKTEKNGLEGTEVYSYDLSNIKKRQIFKWQESYDKSISTKSIRNFKLDEIVIDFEEFDGSDELTEFIPSGDDNFIISNFITQLNEFVLQRSQNLSGWILLDVDSLNEIKYGFIESRPFRNGGFSLISLFNKYGHYKKVYDTYLINDVLNFIDSRYMASNKLLLKVQDDITTISLWDSIDQFDIVKTTLGNGELIKVEQNLNSLRNVISLRYEH